MEKNINLWEKRSKIIELAHRLYTSIISLPADIRMDDKDRHGIQIFLREINSRNIILESILNPSEQAQFFAIEKAVRSESLNCSTSQECQDPEKMKFAGSVTALGYQASTSGLTSDEDTFISLVLLSCLLEQDLDNLISLLVETGAKLPELITMNGNSYLWKVYKKIIKN